MPATYEPIASITTSGGETSVTFSSIPSSWTDLVLAMNTRQNTGPYVQVMRFNGDTGANYSFTQLSGDGASAASFRASPQTYIWVAYFGNGTSTNPQTGIISIQSYANTNIFKTCLVSAAGQAYGVERFAGLWRSTSAINSVTIYPSGASPAYTAGSTFSLYGIKAA